MKSALRLTPYSKIARYTYLIKICSLLLMSNQQSRADVPIIQQCEEEGLSSRTTSRERLNGIIWSIVEISTNIFLISGGVGA